MVVLHRRQWMHQNHLNCFLKNPRKFLFDSQIERWKKSENFFFFFFKHSLLILLLMYNQVWGSLFIPITCLPPLIVNRRVVTLDQTNTSWNGGSG